MISLERGPNVGIIVENGEVLAPGVAQQASVVDEVGTHTYVARVFGDRTVECMPTTAAFMETDAPLDALDLKLRGGHT